MAAHNEDALHFTKCFFYYYYFILFRSCRLFDHNITICLFSCANCSNSVKFESLSFYSATLVHVKIAVSLAFLQRVIGGVLSIRTILLGSYYKHS